MKKTYQITTITTLYVSLSGLITGIFINRTLGPESKGLLTALTLWPPILAVLATLGINEALSYFIGSYTKPQRQLKFIKAQFLLNTIASVLVTLLSIPFIQWVNNNKLGEHTPLAYIYLFFIPIYLFSTSLQGIAMGRQNYRLFNFYRISHSTLYLLGVIYLFLVQSVEVSKYVHLLLLCQIIPLFILIKEVNQLIFKVQLKAKYVFLLLRRSLTFYGPFILAFFSTQWDLMFVVNFFDFKNIGLYQAAYTIALSASLIVAHTFQILVFPLATRIEGSKQKAIFIAENYFLSLIGLVFLAAILNLLAQWIVPLLFGLKFVESVQILQWLAWGYLFVSAKTIASRSIKALAEGKMSFYIELIYSLILVIGILILYSTESFNIILLCALILMAGLAANLYFILQIKTKYHLKWREIFDIKKALTRVLKSLS